MYARVPVQMVGAGRRLVPAVPRTDRSPSHQPPVLVGPEDLRSEIDHERLSLFGQFRNFARQRAVEQFVRIKSIRDNDAWEPRQVRGVGVVQLLQKGELAAAETG